MTPTASCKECSEDTSEMELHAEIEHLKRHLAERDAHIEAMETEFLKGNTRIAELETQNGAWREKYERLYDSHRRVQRLNQNLEEKLLQMVDKCTDDKSELTRDVETLSVRLAESNYMVGHLHKENERFKNDMNLAIQLLQCKPDNFVSQKFDSLPPETQTRVSSYIMSKAKLNQESNLTMKSSSLIAEKINPDDFEFNISASLMSKILEESVQNTISNHCDTCTCLKKSMNPFSFNDSRYSVSTQTPFALRCYNCHSDINSTKSGMSAKCSPVPHLNVTHEEKDMLQLNDKEMNTFVLPSPVSNKNTFGERYVHQVDANPIPKTKTNEEATKLISVKHREIMTKIGDDLKEITIKERFTLPSLEPMTGHHRLCDRTKPPPSNIFGSDKKTENEVDFINKTIIKPVNEVAIKPVIPLSQVDVTFGQIENPVLIPNISSEMKNEPPKMKSESTSMISNKTFHGSSISSNDAESKTSSNHSYKNGGQKVQIGPGPRFCSLIMQAGSKNILLDNAQPNIAPVLYTRQSRNMDTAIPLTYNLNNDLSLIPKQNVSSPINDFSFSEPHIGEKPCNLQKNHPMRILDTVENILDLPNDDLLMREPLDLIEKPESGYKSNESAEIIDKILFGPDNIIKEISSDVADNIETTLQPQIAYDECDIKKESSLQYNKFDDKSMMFKDDLNDPQNQLTRSLANQKMSNDSMKIFNFDNYEKSLKHGSSTKTQDNIIDITITTTKDNGQIASTSNTFIEENKELFNTNFDLKIASKNLSEIHKKFQIPIQVLPDNGIVENQKVKEWKKETYTEKSSSSLSSDDSAAVLQKQQLIRVAEWVQKNLEMEQQTDFENSESCHQSVEEMHHVRNDFPRPAKVDHRIRKGNLKTNHKVPHHISKYSSSVNKHTDLLDRNKNAYILDEKEPELESVVVQLQANSSSNVVAESSAVSLNPSNNKEEVNENPMPVRPNKISIEIAKSISEYTDTNTSVTSKTYSRQELARMEYNVKQFLLNGTRWTSDSTENCPKPRRTSSKTETDL